MRAVSNDRGVVALITALMLGVLVAMAVLVISTGTVALSRERLQDGADAAALAVARTCATGACDPGSAGTYASADAAGAAVMVCGSGIAVPCPAGCLPAGSHRHWDDVYLAEPAIASFPGVTLPPESACSRAAWHQSTQTAWLTG